MTKYDIDYDQICPGVRELVRELNEVYGYVTTDSGDGSAYASGMEGALPYRHVFGVIPAGRRMESVAEQLQARYPHARVEVSWSPGEQATWLLLPDGYKESEKCFDCGEFGGVCDCGRFEFCG